jgi:signal peptide peptidase SppA
LASTVRRQHATTGILSPTVVEQVSVKGKGIMSENTNTAHKLARIVADVIGNPWALTAEKLGSMLAVLELRATGQRVAEQDVRAAMATRAAVPAIPNAARGVAVLPVFGILGQRMNLPLQMSGGTSTELLSRDFRHLLTDDRVEAIVLAFDTPGGSCYGTGELATDIRAARGPKPIVACVNSLAASAGYWLAAQCDRIVCTPGGDVGSIGVITAHEDISAAQEKLGVKTTLITAGKHKADGNPFQPLTEQARANLQRRVDECYARFVASVAAGRGVSEATVREGYGQGKLVSATDALACGMVDEIATIDDVIGDLAMHAGARAPALRSMRATGQESRVAITPQELAVDDWQRRVALDLRLLEL